MNQIPDYAVATNYAYLLLAQLPVWRFETDVFYIASLLENCAVKPYSLVPGEDDGTHIFEKVSKYGFLARDKESGKAIIFFNDKLPMETVRFTIAHEIGHFVLGHSDTDGPGAEKEANCFARNLLCPLPVADAFHLKDAGDYAAFFRVSKTMAKITLSQRHSDRDLITTSYYKSLAKKINHILFQDKTMSCIADEMGFGLAM